jgi:hypothetical protein
LLDIFGIYIELSFNRQVTLACGGIVHHLCAF